MRNAGSQPAAKTMIVDYWRPHSSSHFKPSLATTSHTSNSSTAGSSAGMCGEEISDSGSSAEPSTIVVGNNRSGISPIHAAPDARDDLASPSQILLAIPDGTVLVIHQFQIRKRSVTERKLFKTTATPDAFGGYCIECDLCRGSSRSCFAIIASTDSNGPLQNFGYTKINCHLESQVHLRNEAVIIASIEAVEETPVLSDLASTSASDSRITIALRERSFLSVIRRFYPPRLRAFLFSAHDQVYVGSASRRKRCALLGIRR
jgi:hypothetical protein